MGCPILIGTILGPPCLVSGLPRPPLCIQGPHHGSAQGPGLSEHAEGTGAPGAGALALGFQEEQGVSESRTPGPSCPLVDFHSFHRSPSAPSGKPPLCPALLLEMLACSLQRSHTPYQAAHCAGSHASPGLCLHQLTFSD